MSWIPRKGDERRILDVLRNFDQFLYKTEIEYEHQMKLCYRWYHASFFDFVRAQEGIAEELIDLQQAYKNVATKMWNDLMD